MNKLKNILIVLMLLIAPIGIASASVTPISGETYQESYRGMDIYKYVNIEMAQIYYHAYDTNGTNYFSYFKTIEELKTQINTTLSPIIFTSTPSNRQVYVMILPYPYDSKIYWDDQYQDFSNYVSGWKSILTNVGTSHKLKITKNGYEDYIQTVVVKDSNFIKATLKSITISNPTSISISTTPLSNKNPKVKEYQNKIKLYENKIKQYESKIKQCENKIFQYENEIKQTDNENKISTYEDKISTYEDKISTYEDIISAYEDMISQYEERIKSVN